MKKLLLICIPVAFLFFTNPAVAADGNKMGCMLQGSWIGIGDDVFIVSYSGESASSGTSVEVAPTIDPTIGGLFTDAVEVTSFRGEWKRTGGNTFSYTQIAYALDADRNVVYIGKNSGNKTLSEDCTIMTVEQTVEFFPPGANPFIDEPDFCFPLGEVHGYRMSVDPMCSFE